MAKGKAKETLRDLDAEAPPSLSRPATARRVSGLDDILGQERAIGVIRGAVASGRLHHAWVFGGPAGVGKFTAAVAFAALILDPTVASKSAPRGLRWHGPEPDSLTQRLIRDGTHADLHIITKEMAAFSREQKVREGKQRVIPIDVVKEFLIEPAGRTRVYPGESLAGKVFIVDEAEFLRQDAQDALLKTLEEPPAGSVIVLVTSSEDRLSATVRSRCQRVVFAPLDEAAMRRWLELHEPARGIDAKQREWLLRFAGGSPGWAGAAIENGLYQWHEALSPLLAELDRGRYPVQLGGAMAKLVDERAAAWVKANPDASKEAANYAWAGRMLAFVAEHQRLGLREAVVGRGKGAGARMRAIDLLGEAERQVGTNVNVGLVMENLAAQMAAGA